MIIDKDRTLASDEELLEKIDEFQMAKDTVQSELDQLEYDVEQGNADMIDTQIENIKKNLGYLSTTLINLENYIWDNEEDIEKKLKEEIVLDKI